MSAVRASEYWFRAITPGKYWKQIGDINNFLDFLGKITDIEEYLPQIKFDRNYESDYLLIFKEIYIRSA